ncbi:MAG: DUF1648 domain-containing protein [Ktedonobacterales bacterium]|nr:DUF1648 domain-containing protein [Ktedonobacterales bacterium]
MQPYLYFSTGLIAVLTGLEWFVPAIFRPTNLFGVTVAPDAARQPEGRAIIRRWRASIAALGLAGIALTVALAPLEPVVVLLARTGILLVVALGQVALYIGSHHQAQALAIPEAGAVRTASLAARPHVPLIPWWWEALPLALIGGTAFVLAQQYAAAPAIIPVHWNINNMVDRTAAKSVGSFFLMVWMQVGLYALLTFITATLSRTRIGNNATTGSQQYRLAIARYLFFVKGMIIVLLGTMGLVIANNSVTNTTPSTALFIAPLGFVVVVLAVGTFIFFRYGQGGWRVDARAGTLPAADNMPDSAWKGGVLYYNPNDPALFVERRSGMGFTLNFGHRGSWLFMGGLLVFIVAATVVPIVLAGR